MGLDIVELVIRTEEVFNITIDNYDAEKIRTVGDLYELVRKLLDVSPTPDPDRLTGVHRPTMASESVEQQTSWHVFLVGAGFAGDQSCDARLPGSIV